MTQADLAVAVGLSDHSAIAKRERGDVAVKPAEWKKFAQAFGIGINDFLTACNREELAKMSSREALVKSMRAELDVEMKKALRSRLIPLIGSIPAGWSKVVTHCDDGDYVPAYELNADLKFACVVSGDSMMPALREGDVVVFQRVIDFDDHLLVDGKVVACTFHESGETTVARMTRLSERRIRLTKDNPKFKAREVNLSIDEIDRFGIMVNHRKDWA